MVSETLTDITDKTSLTKPVTQLTKLTPLWGVSEVMSPHVLTVMSVVKAVMSVNFGMKGSR